MKPMLFGSAAVLFAAMTAVPALAAIDNAKVVMGNSTSIASVSDIDGLVGHWTMKDLTALGGAQSVTVFDTKNLYDSKDLSMLGDAQTRSLGDLQKLHQAIDANASLKAWFEKNKIDINRVVTITDTGGAVDVYLF